MRAQELYKASPEDASESMGRGKRLTAMRKMTRRISKIQETVLRLSTPRLFTIGSIKKAITLSGVRMLKVSGIRLTTTVVQLNLGINL